MAGKVVEVLRVVDLARKPFCEILESLDVVLGSFDLASTLSAERNPGVLRARQLATNHRALRRDVTEIGRVIAEVLDLEQTPDLICLNVLVGVVDDASANHLAHWHRVLKLGTSADALEPGLRLRVAPLFVEVLSSLHDEPRFGRCGGDLRKVKRHRGVDLSLAFDDLRNRLHRPAQDAGQVGLCPSSSVEFVLQQRRDGVTHGTDVSRWIFAKSRRSTMGLRRSDVERLHLGDPARHRGCEVGPGHHQDVDASCEEFPRGHGANLNRHTTPERT